jgi:hypothetical protein
MRAPGSASAVSALQRDDVDFDEMLIRSRRQQVRGVVGPISKRKPLPKEMPMIPELAETLRAHKAQMEKLGYPVGAEDCVFVSRTGRLRAGNSPIKAIAMSEDEAQEKPT